MTFLKYLRDHIYSIIIVLIGMTFVELVFFLDPRVHFHMGTLIYTWILALIFLTANLAISYIHKKNWYKQLDNYQNDLSKELFGANNNEQKFIQNKINNISLEYRNELTELYQNQKDQREYTESWVHDIKVPLAALKLSQDDELDKQLVAEELDQIDYLVDQALYFARLNNFSNDYLIQEQDLNDIVKSCIRTNKRLFISKRIGIDLNVTNKKVLTDEKWLSFIINQILSNSLKYTDQGGKISIFSTTTDNNIALHIKDNGIGIVDQDIKRIFNKGFTGSNGRKSGSKSTGMGLYLVKKMTDKLGHAIRVESQLNEGTETIITFLDLPYYK
ncbi:two-component sensor histidine kinase [Companilactobacillus crustorum]|uniref:histidine kinase n=3 Tax=Companilactobacillus TaxID=2767879 RepID=A0A837RIX7_9LACO|nr:sensor histidine kinase [Companilactobacillus crustorum]HCD06678.1 sensor histidine kinase [Lactobacillus sp.]APU71900.1 Sensor histidine kinase GraS [Companilactobacillus crustorum]KRK42693.1 sensor histidine kinase [Companilactobacillus crustorum JCM 15951]KRO21300.1 sensor histidine kinase [Companilactobacillus crustorum]WDT66015.1 sensor histidine kinase [Companilactobacillus crustorum]